MNEARTQVPGLARRPALGQRVLALAVATAFLALAMPARAAEPGRDPTREPSGTRETAGAIFDALTRTPPATGEFAKSFPAPASRPAASGISNTPGPSGGQTGPRAPAQPRAPVVREVRALPTGVPQARPGRPSVSAPRGSSPGGPADGAHALEGSSVGGSPLSDAPLPGQSPWPERRQQSRARSPQTLAPRPGDVVLTLEHDGRERRALVRLPALKAAPGAAKPGKAGPRLPVIVFLHGAGGSASQAMRQTGLAEAAARAGFLAVFPEGLSGPAGQGGQDSGAVQTWNAWSCCGYARDARIDDVGYLAALLARLKAEHPVDPRRIHLAGFSNGAMLASRFALERPGIAASLASVAGYLPCDAPAPREPLPVLVIHGNRDLVARFGPTEAHPRTGRFCEDYPAKAQVEFWARGMGLALKPRQVQDGRAARARLERFGPDRRAGRALVEFVIVKGGGHAWPGGARERFRYCDLPAPAPDATAVMLDFFRRTPRPGEPEKAGPPQRTGGKAARSRG